MDGKETVEEHYPTTTTYRPGNAQIHILNSSRHLSKKTFYDHSDGFHEKRFELNGQSNLIVQFDFGIMDNDSNEFWRCDIKQDTLLAQLFIDGGFRIVPTVSPPYSHSSSIKLKTFDCNNKQLLPYLGGVAFVLPVVEERPVIFGLRIILYRKQEVLHNVSFNVKSHGDGINLDESQSGYLLASIETPLRKKRMTGTFATNSVQKMLFHFQKLGDNGELGKFAEDQGSLIHNMGSNKTFSDLVLAVELQRGITKYGQNEMDECLTICQTVCQLAEERFSENVPFILGKAFYVMSGVHRQRNEFELAKKYLDWSTENFMQVFECSETGNNRYNLAALYAQKAAHCGLTFEEYKLAVESFEEAIRMYRTHEENGPKKIRNIIRTSNRLILLHLKGSRSKFPEINLEVSEEDIAKASKVIEEVDKLLPQCPKRHECTFLIPKADFFTRKALSRAFYNDEEQGRKHLQTATTILRKAKQLSTQLNMAKETTGINQRMERIEHLLQGGLRQYMDRIRQPEPINHSREMVNYGTSNIEELILNVRLENTPNLNQWQWCQCMEGAEKA